MQPNTQEIYKKALRFAAEKHLDQKENGTDLPYVVHVTSVAAEIFVAHFQEPVFDLNFALVLALLHDVLEDTETSTEEIALQFGWPVAEGVEALTKSEAIADKEQRLLDSISRISSLGPEVSAVKLADRITNLDAPSLPWPEDKRRRYMEGSNLILQHLHAGNRYLSERLKLKIKEYVEYVVTGTD